MMEKSYTEKEILIMESLLTLYAKGIPFHNIKVADIAAEAEMGKGTVYEYFRSKEEIIANAVAYRTGNDFLQIVDIIASAKSFEDCTYTMFEKIAYSYETQSGSFFLMHPDLLVMEEVQSVFGELQGFCREKEAEMIGSYLRMGEREGLFPPIAAAYGNQVVIAVMAGFHVMIHAKKDVDIETVMKNSYRMLIKSLK